MDTLSLRILPEIPEIVAGDDLPALFAGRVPGGTGVLVVAQKVVSKAEDRCIRLADVTPSERAIELASIVEKDPRQVELVLGDSRRVVRAVPGVLITETHHGLVCANAGVDLSNAPGDDVAILLPLDPDASAARIREGLGPGTASMMVGDGSFATALPANRLPTAVAALCRGKPSQPCFDRRLGFATAPKATGLSGPIHRRSQAIKFRDAMPARGLSRFGTLPPRRPLNFDQLRSVCRFVFRNCLAAAGRGSGFFR